MTAAIVPSTTITNKKDESNPKMEDPTPIAMSDAIAAKDCTAKDSPAKTSTDSNKKRPSPDSKEVSNKRLNHEDLGDSTVKGGTSEHDAACETQVKVQQDLSTGEADSSMDSCHQDKEKATQATGSSKTDDSKKEDPKKDTKDSDKVQHQHEAVDPEKVDLSPQVTTQTMDRTSKTEPEDSAVESAARPDDAPVDASQESKASKKDEGPSDEQEKCAVEANGANTAEAPTKDGTPDDPPKDTNEATDVIDVIVASQEESDVPKEEELKSSKMTQPTIDAESSDVPIAES
mmetsp:Transcript_16484/g.24332  ORF Transcript_16484/g.24332 Transcript_16484/m.24332 type:complete len:289 (-) Transcript_16484:170-1036(-)